MKRALTILATLPAFPLAAFFAFVGYSKAFAPLAELKRYGAWTVHLPLMAGRLIGVSEMVCALLLLGAFSTWGRRAAGWAAMALVVNQGFASGFHLIHGETGALPQNAVLIMLLALTAWSCLARRGWNARRT